MQEALQAGKPANDQHGLDAATRFVEAIFAPKDAVCLRPIETWIQDGQKRSRVNYRRIAYPQVGTPQFRSMLQQLQNVAEQEHLNLFFGVCPRLGTKGRFDLAWQIRTVRTLWTDIDHVSVAEGRERLQTAGLPEPSILVNSGNGIHAYWLLDEPFVIDDAGDPPAVETEWVENASGKKQARKYIVEDGERVYLDQRRHVSRLSPKAQHVQDVLAGIAQAAGGDHTFDLSRLLRLPGTFNRKDGRNGRTPVLCTLVTCDPSRRYPFERFASLAVPCPESKRAQQIAQMPLPKPRRVSPAKADKLGELIAQSGLAPPGNRSEADFAVCCFAIRLGMDQEELWQQVESVGKFAEQGRRYFDTTWENATFEARCETYERLKEKAEPPQDKHAPVANGHTRPKIIVNPRYTPVGATLERVTERLLRVGNCFERAEQLVVVQKEQIHPILAPPELAGLLSQHVEFYFVVDEAGEYRPFPTNYANTWLNNRVEQARFPSIKLFTRNPVYTDDWRLAPPGYDAASGIYYAGPEIRPRFSTERLDELLRDFCFRSPADRTNYLGMLLTIVLIPRFIGAKPAALFNGNQPCLGKSILAQIISILRDGETAETATYNPNDEEFEKRLGAIVRRGGLTIIVDNAKTRDRAHRIESACLERCLTDPVLSFRLLGKSASIRAENSHIFCITANMADIGRDLVTRNVPIHLHHDGDPVQRTFSIADPEGYALEHRAELLGELLGMVERWKGAGCPAAEIPSRFNKKGWGKVVGGILAAAHEPDFLANASELATMLDGTRREFEELVVTLAGKAQGTWTSAELVQVSAMHSLLLKELGEGSPRSLATKFGTLASRFVDECFDLGDERTATFRKTSGRKGNIYRVEIHEGVPNLGAVAEPLPNLENAQGSAH